MGEKRVRDQMVIIPPTISTGITIDSVVYGTMNTPQQIMRYYCARKYH